MLTRYRSLLQNHLHIDLIFALDLIDNLVFSTLGSFFALSSQGVVMEVSRIFEDVFSRVLSTFAAEFSTGDWSIFKTEKHIIMEISTLTKICSEQPPNEDLINFKLDSVQSITLDNHFDTESFHSEEDDGSFHNNDLQNGDDDPVLFPVNDTSQKAEKFSLEWVSLVPSSKFA